MQVNPEAMLLLVVPDEAMRNALSTHLSAEYVVDTAPDGGTALDVLKKKRFSLALVEIDLPDVSGLDFVSQALGVDTELAIVMLSATNDATLASRCMQQGAMDYIPKPFEMNTVSRALRGALKRREQDLSTQRTTQWLNEEVAQLNVELSRERAKLERLAVATLEALVNALEAKDPYARGHSARVADLAATVASQLELDDDDVERIRMAGRLHDLGNIGIREETLNRRRSLSDNEYDHITSHVEIGARIIAPLEPLRVVAELIRHHHERWDGLGYPDGLVGEEIPMGARILAAAEVYDALTESRPYQDSMAAEGAVDKIHELSGTVLDPRVADALGEVVQRRQALSFIFDTDYTPRWTRENAPPPPKE